MSEVIAFIVSCSHFTLFTLGVLVGGTVFGAIYYFIGWGNGRSALAQEISDLRARAHVARGSASSSREMYR